MTKYDFWSSWLAIWFLAGPFLLAVAHLAFSLYLSHRHMDALKEALKNGRYIYLWGPNLGKRGWIWSILDMAKITGMIMMLQTHIRIGDLDSADHKIFPPYLKRLLKLNVAMIIATGVWLVVVFVLLKFN